MTQRYWLLIAALGIGWGSSFLFNAILLRELGPLTVSLGRVGLGALGCWVWALGTGKPMRLPASTVLRLMFLGCLFFAIPFALYPFSQRHIPSGVAGIINAMTPVMVVIVSHLWPGGERATAAKSAGVLVGFAGIAILSLPVLRGGVGAELWAIIMAASAPLCYGVASNMARRFKAIEPTVVAGWSLSGATLLMLPVALGFEGVPVITRPETWGALAMIGFVLTSAAFIVLYWLLPRVGATTSSTVTFIAPVSAVFLGMTVLGEAILPAHLFGMIAIFAGLLLIDGRLVAMLRRPPAI
ncbi:MAG: DMT family transporter [Albidovulum sp.]